MGYGTRSTRRLVLRASAACLCLGAVAASMLTITASDAFAGSTSSEVEAIARHERLVLTQEIVKRSFGLDDVDIAALAVVGDPAGEMTVDIFVDGIGYTLALHTHSVRSDIYEVRVQHADGSWTNAVPSPVTSLRGHVLGVPDTAIAGALLEDGLHATIRMGADPATSERIWIEPIGRIVPDSEGLYAIYRGTDVQPIPNGCGTSHAAQAEGFAQALAGVDADADKNAVRTDAQFGGGGGGNCVAELACDADTEYFNTYGSVAATEAQINAVINAVNLQYESQVTLTHQITTIIVRTSSDPYTSTDPETRLCQFITEWTNNQTGVQRDVAHLFTGAQINGSVIGIAADIGQTGICVTQGSCTGGQFGTQGSYCLSQSDFDSNFACKTDLTAHELGHLWGAFHCSCPSNTMNSFITCANSFSGGSIASILNYKATRTCLSGNCSAGTTGACCFSDGSCAELPGGASCQSAGGAYEGDDTDCSPNPCPAPMVCGPGAGSCFSSNGTPGCDDSACCQLICGLDPFCCETEWDSICADAADDNCSVASDGACCFSNGNCTIQTANECGSLGGVYEGDGTDCNPNPCPQPNGACCFANGSCTILTASQCAGNGGAYQGNGSDCNPNPCPQPTGACCFSTGACAELTAGQCASNGGSYQGDGSDCTPNPCPQPTGACCFGDGSCAELTSGNCAGQGGSYQGDGSDCTPNPCPQPTGACCFGDALCVEFTSAGCAANGGMYEGDFTTCNPNPCPNPMGACCFDDGSCAVTTAAACVGNAGIYQGDDTDCSPNPCPQPTGACCFSDGSCNILLAADCVNSGGEYQGNGSGCQPNPCAQPVGACCLAGDCFQLTDVECAQFAGVFMGVGVTCTPNPCPQVIACPWDCQPPGGNGIVNIDDLLETINQFGAVGFNACDSEPDNGDGTFGNSLVNIDDLLGVINNFGNCP